MSAEACAALVERGDPDRWRGAMTAPPGRRAGLMALYAFNLEIARAPWLASDPLLVEIRLRWWQDALDEIFAGASPRRHEVVEPLAAAIRDGGLPQAPFVAAITARLAELSPFPDQAALLAHVDATAGSLTELAARYLGAGDGAVGTVRDFARGAGIAAWLVAVPALAARGRVPLPVGVTVVALAAEGQAALARARAARRDVPAAAAPALLAGWRADVRLARARREGAAGDAPELQARAALAWRTLTGRW